MKKLFLMGAVLLTACGSSDVETFKQACVDSMKERLTAPSTFKLVEFTDVSKPITFDSDEIKAMEERLENMGDYKDLSEIERVKRDRLMLDISSAKNGEDSGTVFEGLFQYDADNSYGTPIRGTFSCEYEAWDSVFDASDVPNVLVNGQTHMDWLLEQTKDLINR